jgi:hypothetical protein
MLPGKYVTWHSGPDCNSRSWTESLIECSPDLLGRCYMKDSQKISLQCIHFGPFSFSSNKNSSNFIILLSKWNWAIFYNLLISVHVLCCQPLCHNCFHLAIIFKFVAVRLLLQCWKQMITAQWWILMVWSQWKFFGYKIICHVNLLSDQRLYNWL